MIKELYLALGCPYSESKWNIMNTNGDEIRNSEKPELSLLRKKIKSLNLVYGGLFLISFFLLVYASASQKPAPLWMGVIDGVIAFLVVGLSLYLYVAVTRFSKQSAFALSYKRFIKYFEVAATFTGILFFVLWLKRESLDFNILLPGLAWRMFILLYTIPFFAFVRGSHET
jgi:hypothetical protein